MSEHEGETRASQKPQGRTEEKKFPGGLFRGRHPRRQLQKQQSFNFFFSSGLASSFFFFGSLTLGFRVFQCRFFVSVYYFSNFCFCFWIYFISIFVFGSLSLSLTTSSNPLSPNSVFLLSCYHNRIPNITRFAILYNTSTPLDLPLCFIIQGTLLLCISSDSLPLTYPVL